MLDGLALLSPEGAVAPDAGSMATQQMPSAAKMAKLAATPPPAVKQEDMGSISDALAAMDDFFSVGGDSGAANGTPAAKMMPSASKLAKLASTPSQQ